MHYKLEQSRQTFPLGLFSSIFIHNSIEHLQNNSIFLLIFGTLFFYFKGIKQGVLLFPIIGIGAHFFEFIIMEYTIYYLEMNYSDWQVLPSSAGSSGVLSGILFVVSLELFTRLSLSYKENREKKEEDKENFLSFRNLVCKIIPPFFPAYLLLERITADFEAFFLKLTLHPSEFEKSSHTGSAYLAHFWGVIITIILLTIIYLINRNKSPRINGIII